MVVMATKASIHCNTLIAGFLFFLLIGAGDGFDFFTRCFLFAMLRYVKKVYNQVKK